MQVEKILKFFALEGYGSYVWTTLLITLIALLGYFIYLLREHKSLQQRITRSQSLKPEGKRNDT